MNEVLQTGDVYDLVIAGMGPVGAIAANLAGRAGLRTLAVDGAPEIYALPRAIHFDADVMRIFQSVGLTDLVERIVRTYRGAVHLGMDGEPIRDFRVTPTAGPQGWYPHYGFFQPQLEQVIRDGALSYDNVTCRFETEMRSTEQFDEHVEVTMRTSVGAEMIVKTRYVIACDGASSRTRKSLGIDFLDYNFNEPWIIIDANVPDADMLEDYTIMWCDPKRPGTYVPGPGRHRRWEFMLLDGETAENMCTVEAINGLLAPVVPLEGLEVIRSAVYQFHGLIASRWRDRRILLAGDAAHQTPPFYGQGMCHGIRDVANLMWKLRLVLEHPELNALLDTYQVERQAHVKTIIDASVENGRYICTLDPEVARERDARLRARAADGQDIASFRSVVPGLVGGLISQIEPAAAERGEPMWQPQVEIRGAGSGLLDDALGPGFALLYTQAPSKTPDLTWFGELGATCARISPPGSDLRQEPHERVIQDLGGTFTAWFKRNNAAAVLVRPDHYIYGLADGPDAADRLLADLHRQFDALSVDQS